MNRNERTNNRTPVVASLAKELRAEKLEELKNSLCLSFSRDTP